MGSLSVVPDGVTVARLEAWVLRFAELIAAHRSELTDLDSAIGDADHGINMERGMRAVSDKLDTAPPATVDELFKLVGMTLVSSVGGAVLSHPTRCHVWMP